MTENIEEQAWYKNSLGQHLEILKSEAEAATAVIANNFPETRIYLFGGTARKLLGNKERIGRKIFSHQSDLDLWVEFTEEACGSLERFYQIEKGVEEVLKKRRSSIKIEGVIMLNDGGNLWPGSACSKGFVERFSHDIIDNKEMILLYEKGEFFIPWREEVVE